jgi:hypothetical protein
MTWKLPNAAAVNVISVQVTDDKGGYAFRSISLQSGANQIQFNGVVRDRANGAVIPAADITLIARGVARRATTDAKGIFAVAIPDSPRYVLNVNKLGYALVSRVFFTSATGLDLLLDRAQMSTMNGEQGGSLIYERKNTVSLKISSGSLVDARGNKVTGSIRGYAFAYDLDQSNPIPGDLSAKALSGRDVRLESYGSVDITLTDPSGNKLQLAPGATAEISFSVHPGALATAPAVIPLLTYNEATGYWIEEGQLRRNGNRYEGQVRHFSAFNADTVFNNTSCLQFNVADHEVPSFPFVLHLDYSTAGGPRHNDYQVTQTNNLLERLPPNTLMTVTLFPGTDPGTVGSANPHVLGTFHWNSGPQTATDVYPVVNFNTCNGFDTAPLSGNPANPAVVQLTVPGHETFITGFGPGSQPISDAYYTSLGVLGGPTLRDNFQHWKATNGFNNDPTILVSGEANAQYFNNGDLQLGRDMHCLKTTPSSGRTHIACYVSNYGNGPLGVQGDPQFGSQHAVDHDILPLATVAMEYDDQGLALPPVDAVQFYAYQAGGGSFENPGLDSEGGKYLPQNCMACHGGSYNFGTNRVEQSSFLAFDLFSFLYDNRPASHKGLEDQQEQLRQLNLLVKATKPNSTNPNDPIVSFINGMYAWGACDVNTLNCRAEDGPTAAHPADQGPYTPPGFQTNAATIALYQTIPRPYCRTCHVALGSSLPPDWTQYSQMINHANQINIRDRVCVQTEVGGVPTGDLKFMPHAEVPFKAFWFSNNPAAPAFLGDPLTGIGLNPPLGSTDRCPR